jgi:N-acetylglucosamine kinase-like BadF-type ATPase
MVVICDSGSTKADWVFVNPGGTEMEMHTMGFNPVFHKEEKIVAELLHDFTGKVKTELPGVVNFYGAGCWDDNLKHEVKKALVRVFPNSNIFVEHDLLGAARATCGNNSGIACILGTGSNSCLFDGQRVIDNITNLGYLVGDEGSGSYIGKMLLRAYFYREMPRDLVEIFELEFPGGKQEVLDGVYEGLSPNVYLASFSRFMSDHKKHFFIEKLVYQAFSEFVDRHVRKYTGHLHVPVHFIGSVAYHFSDILKIVLEERRLTCGVIIKKPIDNLVKYHLAAQGIN